MQLVLQQLAVSGTQQPGHLHQPGGGLLTQDGHDVWPIWPAAELPQGGEYRHVCFTGAAVFHTLPPGNTHRMLHGCLCRKRGDHGRFANACLSRHQDHAPPSLHGLGDRRGPVHHAQRVANGRHPGLRDDVCREVLHDLREQRIEMRLDDRADQLERESFRGRVDRQHAPLSGSVVVGPEIDELARLQLPAVEEAHVARDEEHVALVDGAVEEGLPRP